MLFGGIANAFLGLALTFASVALIASSVTEALASLLKLRAAHLLDGLRSLVNAPSAPSDLAAILQWVQEIWKPRRTDAQTTAQTTAQTNAQTTAQTNAQTNAQTTAQTTAPPYQSSLNGTALLNGLLKHALINPRGSGETPDKDPRPSYVDSKHFAAALLDVISGDAPAKTLADIETAIDKLPKGQMQTFLKGACARADTDIAALRAEIATWFDAGMDRVSGSYKRHAQAWSFVIGLVVASAFNIDAIAIAHVLFSNPAFTVGIPEGIGSNGPDQAGEMLKLLKDAKIPLGWDGVCPGEVSWWVKIPGWLITASASLFGAPFWFDLLDRFVKVRGTGAKPPAAKTEG